MTLHSNNIWEDEENKIIYSTNLLKTEIKGTNTESEYDDNSEWHREISNNIDFNQYGFPLNNIKVNNGVGDKNTSNNIYIDNGSNIEVDNTINRNMIKIKDEIKISFFVINHHLLKEVAPNH